MDIYDTSNQWVTETFPVNGMHCASCKANIERALTKLEGVSACTVNFATEKAQVTFNPEQVTLETMNERLEPYGYRLNTAKIQSSKLERHNHSTLNKTKMVKKMQLLGSDHVMYEKASKEEALQKEKNKALFVFPLSVFVFFTMMWDLASQFSSQIPLFPMQMRFYQLLLFFLASIVLFGPGRFFLGSLVRFLQVRRASMDTLVGIGTLTAYLYSSFRLFFSGTATTLGLSEASYFDVTIIVIGFILFGKYLEASSKRKTGEALEKLIQLQSKYATVIRDGKEHEVPIEQVSVGDLLLIKPAGKIPVDGVIVEGASSIDESMVTGEPLPVDKTKGESVIGGTINQQSVLVVQAKKVGNDTLLARIVEMVETAQGSKAPIEHLADQISAVFVPVVMVIASITLLVWITLGSHFLPFTNALTLGLTSFVGVLVIACPCALGLATPTAIIAGVGKAAEHGILIKDAESLEKLRKVTTVIMDKTGTLTTGKPVVTDIIQVQNSKLKVKSLLQILASLEKHSEHPLAHAILEKAKKEHMNLSTVSDFRIVQGKGVTGNIDRKIYYAGNASYMRELHVEISDASVQGYTKEGKTPIFLTNGKTLLGSVFIADQVKDTAKQAVEKLQTMGLQIVMLTGDDKHTAEYIAKKVGIHEVYAEVLPDRKAEIVERFKMQDATFKNEREGKNFLQLLFMNHESQKQIVAFVGDGVNDAPALATADVGIAMSTGTDIAIGAAQLTILRGDIKKVADAMRISRFTMRTVKQNLFWAFLYNSIGIPLAAGAFYPFFGITLNPVFAGAAMAFSSVSVVANSLLLKNKKL